jgi:large subunit ribosomal protein L35
VTKLKKYKIKTHKATAKRIRITGTGKVLRTHVGKSHFRRRTPKRTKRQFDKLIGVGNPAIRRRIKKLAPYLSKYRQNPGHGN